MTWEIFRKMFFRICNITSGTYMYSALGLSLCCWWRLICRFFSTFWFRLIYRTKVNIKTQENIEYLATLQWTVSRTCNRCRFNRCFGLRDACTRLFAQIVDLLDEDDDGDQLADGDDEKHDSERSECGQLLALLALTGRLTAGVYNTSIRSHEKFRSFLTFVGKWDVYKLPWWYRTYHSWTLSSSCNPFWLLQRYFKRSERCIPQSKTSTWETLCRAWSRWTRRALYNTWYARFLL